MGNSIGTENRKIRQVLCDDESHIGFSILKNVSRLRLTYQIKLLIYKAVNEKKFFILKIPDVCEISPKLQQVIDVTLTEDGQNIIDIMRI